MNIVEIITEETFNEFNIDKIQGLLGIVDECHWFRVKESNLLGTILFDKIDRDWGYVILALDEDGQFRFTDGDSSIETEGAAINALTKKLEHITKTGKIEKELYHSDLFDENSSIIITDIDNEIKKFFRKYPDKMYNLNPRKFEELIASIFQDLGFNVQLTPATRDGGRDIIASLRNSVASFLTYVECKRYAPKNKIDVSIIRQVQGVHYTNKPSKSIIVTTSFFTKAAIKEAKKIEHQLELKDFNDITKWLENY
ncbi:MAG: restriction endonuclease [Flavobacteriales bacterium]|jgi:restriction endonuclease Mrr|nr:restriction endonuclease [Flavobacteriales bacterium]